MSKEELKQKKAHLDHLYYDLGQQKFDFELAGTFIGKDGEIGFSKWKKYSECVFPIDFDGSADDWKEASFFKQINQRQILPNEVILDLEEKKSIKSIIKELKLQKVIFYVYATGSKGFHVHIFYKRDLTEKEKLSIIKYYKADEMKAGLRALIALEWAKHWKSGKIKKEVFKNE